MPQCRYLPNHDHIAFRDMLVFRGHKASSRKVRIKTGYPEPILDRVWKDSVGELDDLRVGGSQRCYLKVEFLLAFMWNTKLHGNGLLSSRAVQGRSQNIFTIFRYLVATCFSLTAP